MEKEVKTLKNQRNDMIYNFPVDKEKFKKIKELYSKWKLARKNYDRENSEILAIAIRRDADSISIKTKEIGMLAMNTSINFAISVFPEQVEFLYFTNKIKIPILDECGEIMFSGYNYSLLDFEVEKNG
jgi:hypothetical protein